MDDVCDVLAQPSSLERPSSNMLPPGMVGTCVIVEATMGFLGNRIMAEVSGRDLAGVRAAIAAGEDVNEAAAFGETPLMRAARKNLVDIARVLLDHGADVEAAASYGSTAFFEACDSNAPEAALLLLSRGATGDKQGAGGRTALQIAVKRGMTRVVRVMLEAGLADPNAMSVSGKDALQYVKGRGAQAQELRRLVAQFVSIESAVESGSVRAMEGVLKRVFRSEDIDVCVRTFLAMAEAAPAELEPYRVRLLLSTVASDRADLFERVLTATLQHQNRLQAIDELRFADVSGMAVLHIAANYGHYAFVEYLLVECGVDPRVKDAHNRRPIDVVDDVRDAQGRVRALLLQATRRYQFREFSDRLVASTGSVDELERLAQSLSSVLDIRALFSLSVSVLGNRRDEMKRVLTRAFAQLIEEKLVYNDEEALFCKAVLRECLRRGLLSEVEFEYWSMQVVKVNMESATWVAKLKQSVRRLNWRVGDLEHQVQALQTQYKNLKDAVESRSDGGESQVDVARSLSVLTSLLENIGVGDGVDAVFGSALDLSSPHNVLMAAFAMDESQVDAFICDPNSTAVVVSEVAQSCFDQAGIDPVEFAGLLRDAVAAELQATDEADSEACEPTLLDAAGEVVAQFAELNVECEEDEEKPNASSKEEDELIAFPFHYAVKNCEGDVGVFQDVVEFIEEHDGDVNAVMNVEIPLADGSKPTRLNATALIYASHLGYVDVVRQLLLRRDLVPTEKKFVTMQRAQQQQQQREGRTPAY